MYLKIQLFIVQYYIMPILQKNEINIYKIYFLLRFDTVTNLHRDVIAQWHNVI